MLEDDHIPITPRQAYNANYWRKRAKIAREKAATYFSEPARSELVQAAVQYEKLALHADNLRKELKREPH